MTGVHGSGIVSGVESVRLFYLWVKLTIPLEHLFAKMRIVARLWWFSTLTAVCANLEIWQGNVIFGV